MDPRWKAVHLDEVEAVPWLGSELNWRPLRHALGARVIGIAAFTAERVGQELIEAHTETQDGRGHEEIYVVLRGRASFTHEDRPEFKVLERAARGAGFRSARVPEYLPYRMLEVEAAANAVGR